ncbi:MAG: protein TonB [Arenicella sp.]|jgi:protein TonB
MNSSLDLLSVTAFFSALVHAVLILGISFKLPDLAETENTDNTLDVVLVNNTNNEVPLDAKTISSSNNQGGGEDDKEASSPVPYKPTAVSPIDSIKLTAEQKTISSISPDQLITGAGSQVRVQRKNPNQTELKYKVKRKGLDKITTKSARELERERLIAKINQSMEDYSKRPNKEFLSPTTAQHEAAKYLDDWRKKVESVGNTNYPLQAKARSLAGTLILTVEINRNGTIASIQVNNPSPHKILNDSAVRFVRDASPFSSFPDEIDANTDILVITRAFHFLSNNRMSSSDASSQR